MTHDSDRPTAPSIEDALAMFFGCADVIIGDGLAHARAEAPERFAAMHAEFDGGLARPRLVVDYLAGGQLRIAHHLIGQRGGEEKVVELFATLVQGPQLTRAH